MRCVAFSHAASARLTTAACAHATDSWTLRGGLVRISQERSQLKNKELAMQMLRSKLYQMQIEEQQAAISSARKMQVLAWTRWRLTATHRCFHPPSCAQTRLLDGPPASHQLVLPWSACLASTDPSLLADAGGHRVALREDSHVQLQGLALHGPQARLEFRARRCALGWHRAAH